MLAALSLLNIRVLACVQIQDIEWNGEQMSSHPQMPLPQRETGSNPEHLLNSPKSDREPLINHSIFALNKFLEGFGAYPVLIVAILVGYKALFKEAGIGNSIGFLVAVSFPIAIVLLFHTVPAWRRAQRRRALEELGITGRLTDTGYFKLKPYEETDQQFNRADSVHYRVLEWIRQSKAPLLYLTGFSGTGKSSMLQAWVLPKLRSEHPQFRTVRARLFGDPFTSIRAALLVPGNIWQKPPKHNGDLTDLLQRAQDHIKPKVLLLVLDQFEEFVVLHSPDKRNAFRRFLQSVVQNPPLGLRILLVIRSDYIGLVEQDGLPPFEQHKNWEEVPPFTERDAMQFLADSGLQIGTTLRQKILDESREIEDTPGQIRPITINLFGMVLKQSSERLPSSYRPGSLLRSYLKDIVNRSSIREHAARVLTLMVTAAGTKCPKSLSDLAATTRVDFRIIRGCLIRLGEEGLVRELDPEGGIWEISHDFVARLLHYVFLGWRANIWRRIQPWVAIIAVIGWLVMVAVMIPAYTKLYAAQQKPQVLTNVAHMLTNLRSDTRLVRLTRSKSFMFAVDVPPATFSSYDLDVVTDSGIRNFSFTASAQEAKDIVQIFFPPGSLSPGRYFLIIKGISSGQEQGEVERLPFVVELED